mmetsp:Transcript_12452/g.31808  ORF Transcript_12452/g.31808 Transcript_12452/m.31808 type:complete len:206 (+) Transcript_12452:1047-1664(+)
MKRCWPTGRPSSCSLDGNAKRNTRVSCEISVLDSRGSVTNLDFCRVVGGPVGAAGSTDGAAGAGVPVGVPVSARSPMRNSSSLFHALLECSASNSSVQSCPPLMRMEAAPPGWSSRYLVASYTLPLTTIQMSSLVVCLATSSMVKSFPVLAVGLGASTTAAPCLPRVFSSNHPPKLPGPASVGCWNLSAGIFVLGSMMRWTLTRK